MEMNKLYYWKRTEGWDWFGAARWWEIFIEPLGYNGVGGIWLREHWRWNDSSESLRKEIRTLSAVETEAILRELTI